MNDEIEDTDRSFAAFMSRLKTGSAGLAKVAIGMDRADDERIRSRESICRDCPSGLFSNGRCDASRGGCGCFLAAKWRLASERCPKGHW